MFEQIRKDHSLTRILLILLIIAVGTYVLGIAWGVVRIFLDIFITLIMAWILSFILDPVVELIRKLLKVSKLISTIITYFLLLLSFAAIGFIYIPLIGRQTQILSNVIPLYLETAPKIIISWMVSLTTQLENSVTLIPSVAQFLFSTVMVLIFSFYFIVDREAINREIFNFVPKSWHEILKFTQQVINDTFVSFLRVQLFFSISCGLLTWLILRILNIDFAASIALLSGILAFIPLMGPFLSLIPPVVIALLVDPVKAVIIGIVLVVLQQVIFNVIGPKLLGNAFKLHPAVILISFMVGLKFEGFLGAILAIPVLGISAVMIRRFGHYFLKIKE